MAFKVWGFRGRVLHNAGFEVIREIAQLFLFLWSGLPFAADKQMFMALWYLFSGQLLEGSG